ncbi:MAG: succinate dehydrogenase iron-sulfur subunit [Chloroflexota bacterium]|uniref:succinate dehydrogenase n=1 Tax=marine metagenome TaxID=408172 RepID=A0A381VXW8_9ZZZZ|nr:succinate dehydrogenase iron-sulfur subunit [Chloroflexota bacterium]
MEATLKVKRFDPEADDPQPFWQDFTVEIDDKATVLDALIKIREDNDGAFSLRCSCRSAICGSCAVRINGNAGLACKTQAATAMKDGVITVEPAGNMPVIKDLVVNFDGFWDKVMEIEPYLKPEGEEPEAEYIASNEAMLHLSSVTACIMCGSCVSDCTVMEVDPTFLGPAALAKAYRFTADPRDGDENGVSASRLEELTKPSGMWDCTRCMECVAACPKGVAPMDRIMAMRDQAIDAGFHNTNGARHTEAFSDSVEHSGWLDELRLVPKSVGMTNVSALVGYAPIAIQALTHGKMPSIIHKKIEKAENVKKIFDKVETPKKRRQ